MVTMNFQQARELRGHMEKQEMEMKWKLEMETRNGNWKWKWKWNKNAPIIGAMFSSWTCT